MLKVNKIMSFVLAVVLIYSISGVANAKVSGGENNDIEKLYKLVEVAESKGMVVHLADRSTLEKSPKYVSEIINALEDGIQKTDLNTQESKIQEPIVYGPIEEYHQTLNRAVNKAVAVYNEDNQEASLLRTNVSIDYYCDEIINNSTGVTTYKFNSDSISTWSAIPVGTQFLRIVSFSPADPSFYISPDRLTLEVIGMAQVTYDYVIDDSPIQTNFQGTYRTTFRAGQGYVLREIF